jgi:uncharacterized protein YjbJ (UPF0337 family)
MDEFRKKSVDEQVGGKVESLKGKIKEGLGKVTGDSDLEAEGQVDQGEGKAREQMGKAGRAVSDAAERVKDKLRGYDKE